MVMCSGGAARGYCGGLNFGLYVHPTVKHLNEKIRECTVDHNSICIFNSYIHVLVFMVIISYIKSQNTLKKQYL